MKFKKFLFQYLLINSHLLLIFDSLIFFSKRSDLFDQIVRPFLLNRQTLYIVSSDHNSEQSRPRQRMPLLNAQHGQKTVCVIVIHIHARITTPFRTERESSIPHSIIGRANSCWISIAVDLSHVDLIELSANDTDQTRHIRCHPDIQPRNDGM